MVPEWLAIAGMVVAILVPLATLIVGLDARASSYRKDMHAKIDSLRSYTEGHHHETLLEMGRMNARLAVIEDRSHRIRKGDNE